MCRLLCATGPEPFDVGEHLASFARVARESREYQGHGWGCAWLDEGQWCVYRCIAPVWEDSFRPPGPTKLLVAHARSAFRNEGVRIENNMPFFDGERVFAFNGELRGVRIRERGRIGAEKVFNFVKRFDRGDFSAALRRGVAAIEARTRYVRAMNLVVADASGGAYAASRFNESRDYFQMWRAQAGAVRLLCSQPCPELGGKWTPVPNGTALSL